MSDAPILLEMRSITKEFPGVKALSDVNLVVRAGEIHAICGENGAGKSTLMKVLSGVYPHGTYDGDIVYQGTETRFSDIRASEHAGIVIIQLLALFRDSSIDSVAGALPIALPGIALFYGAGLLVQNRVTKQQTAGSAPARPVA